MNDAPDLKGSAWQDRLLAPRYVLPMLVVSIVLVLAIIAAAIWSSLRQSQYGQQVQHTFTVERHIGLFLEQMQGAETGQRGYLLTGEVVYLEPYEAALPLIPQEIVTLGQLTADNPTQTSRIAELERLSAGRLDLMARTIASQRAGDAAAARDLVASGEGKRLMDALRQVVAEMRADEDQLLARRIALMNSAADQLRIIIIASALVVLALGALVILSMRRTARLLEARNAALQREITIRQAVESQIVQMQKIEAVGQLTSGIAHDFNNMLSIIIGSLGVMERRLSKGDTAITPFINAAMDGARRAATLTARLLAFSRKSALQPTPLSSNRLVSGMSELLGRTLGEHIKVETVLAGGLWTVLADASQVENSILNLAVNARDAMPEGGKLTIETANCHLDQAYAEMHPEVKPGQHIMIAVTDTGPGMTEDVIAKAFDPFFTTKPVGKGTGLGLSQVYGFVKQSGGHVRIYSELGVGTTVKIYLPRHVGEEDGASQRDTRAASMPAAAAGQIILVVEDDDHVRTVATASLRELGYVVLESARPADALAQLRANPDIALLFTDVVMPDMNGRKLADLAIQERPKLKVIFTTGYTQNAVVHNGVLDPGVEFIMKPYTVDQLAQIVARVLRQ